MKKELDLSHRYSFEIDDAGSYKFRTSAGLIYKVSFSPSNVHFPNYPGIVAEISFYPEGEKQNITDIKVKQSILYLILEFLKQDETNALIFVCDMSDNKQTVRKRLFENWYQQYNNGTFIKLDSEITVENSEYFCSLIITNSNPFRKFIIDTYSETLDLYNK